MNTPRPKIRLSRLLGLPLTPKAVAYFERRPYPPGEHGCKRRQASGYSTRLLEKQRLRAQYDVSAVLRDHAVHGVGRVGVLGGGVDDGATAEARPAQLVADRLREPVQLSATVA